jgi:hypothetical protein
VVNFAPRHRFGFLVGAADFLAAVPGECGRFPPVERHRLLIGWLVKTCVQDGIKTSDLMDPDAIELLAERLRTPLQIEMPFRLGEKRVSAEVFEQVLSRAIDELEPTLTRNGYDAPALTVLLRAKPSRPAPSAHDRRTISSACDTPPDRAHAPRADAGAASGRHAAH